MRLRIGLFVTSGLYLGACIAIALVLVAPGAARAETVRYAVEIENDVGGDLHRRVADVRAKREAGLMVRIVGDVCYSSCTLYLGLPDTCVSPTTTFGFHGPSTYGKPLTPQDFEQASQVIASHYPPVLREWYMTVARHELRGLLKVSGLKLYRIGAARLCAQAS